MNPNPAVVELGQSLTLTCQADGFPKPSYSWKFNGGAIGDSQNTLQLASAQVLNAGNYTCVATNTFGSAQETRLVNVRCKFSTMKNFWSLKQSFIWCRLNLFHTSVVQGQILKSCWPESYLKSQFITSPFIPLYHHYAYSPDCSIYIS